MPKHEILHSAGKRVPPEIRELLTQFFDKEAIDKLERLGGRVLISLATPYKRKEQSQVIEIDTEFVGRLSELRDHPSELRNTISVLSSKQLRQLGQLLRHPLKVSAKRQDMIEELIRYFHDEAIWRAIADHES